MIIPQPISTIATVAAGAVTFILSAASISNMYDTYSLVQQHRQQLQLQSPITPPEVSVVSKVKKWSSVDEALDGLSTMNKKDLVELFLHCEAPSISDLSFSDSGQEDWRYDGLLLDNGPILTPVTNFITNKLFGRGKPWLGKAFMKPTKSSNGANFGIGRNRFSLGPKLPVTTTTSNTCTEDEEVLDQTFDYSIKESVLSSKSSKSLFHIYAPHCRSVFSSPLSLAWLGMVDELRVLELGDKTQESNPMILGMGYFQWSGGVWNVAPFCLVPRKLN